MRILLLVVLALVLSAQAVAASEGRVKATITPDPVFINSFFHVEACGLPRDQAIHVIVDGARDEFGVRYWNEFDLTSTTKGCLSFDFPTSSGAGTYGLLFYDYHGNPQHELALFQFQVVAP